MKLPFKVSPPQASIPISAPLHLGRLQRLYAHNPTSVDYSTSSSAPAAALMVIGNEILSGAIIDVNGPWLAKLLYNRGIDLLKVEYVLDDPQDIEEACLRLRTRVGPQGYVFTSGGIGPTHDDITYSSIASALGLSLELHQPTVERMKAHYEQRGLELNEARLRMAQLPTPLTDVLWTPDLWVPLAVVGGNVYILPGIPRLFQQMVLANVERLPRGPASHVAMLYSASGEGDLAASLESVATAFPTVRIGSYPNAEFDMNHPTRALNYRVKLVFEGRDAKAVAEAVQAALTSVPGVSSSPSTN